MIDGDPTYGYLALFATEPTPATDLPLAGETRPFEHWLREQQLVEGIDLDNEEQRRRLVDHAGIEVAGRGRAAPSPSGRTTVAARWICSA